ncbi:hypothetical protein SHK09_14680 [Polaribacter sp. PL03]|uniref:hypothetical protein n=1 Tax=Polaribacter sp. PL03 TaxID=3088353 RepID=UPI0029CF5B8E|nr:hypothetical protein [Polaribacter sp. PL03]MDX6748040.1 hypothetical protein [Polaribacter sp. PL03]
MNIIESIKTYFTAKVEGNTSKKAPVGICPNCWGKQEWEGDFYKQNKGNKLVSNDQTYNNFINKIVESNISGIVINADTYQCETCKTSYKS